MNITNEVHREYIEEAGGLPAGGVLGAVALRPLRHRGYARTGLRGRPQQAVP